jgi:AraC-like DNA-binding protein
METVKFLEHVKPDGSIYFQVSGMGIMEQMPPCMVKRPRGTGHWLLVHFHDPVELMGRHGIESLDARSLILWEPDAPQLFGNASRPWTHSWMQFQGTAVESLVSLLNFPLSEPLPHPGDDAFERILHEIYQERICQTVPDQVILERLFNVLLRRVSRTIAVKSSERSLNAVRMLNAKRQIDMNYKEDMSLTSLASLTNLSVQHFCAEFKRNFKVSPMDYLTSVRIRQAQYLLLDENLSVSEIAYKVGYKDLCHFSKMYKRRTGVSPAQTRKMGALHPSSDRQPVSKMKLKAMPDGIIDCIGATSGK